MGADPRKAPAREKDDKRNGKQITEQRREKGLAERSPIATPAGSPPRSSMTGSIEMSTVARNFPSPAESSRCTIASVMRRFLS